MLLRRRLYSLVVVAVLSYFTMPLASSYAASLVCTGMVPDAEGKSANAPKDERDACESAAITGELSPSDADQISQEIGRAHALKRLYLYDIGGDTEAGITLGRAIRLKRILTVAPYSPDAQPAHATLMRHDVVALTNVCVKEKTCACVGVCTYVWAGGIIRDGNVLSLTAAEIERASNKDAKTYFEKMDLPIPTLVLVAGGQPVLPPDLAHLRYPAEVLKSIVTACGPEPTLNRVDAIKLQSVQVGTPIQRNELAHLHDVWVTCGEETQQRRD